MAPEPGILRMTVALTGRQAPPWLGTVLRLLGDARGAELHAVFIEDSDALKAAALPFTVEFCTLTNARRPLSRPDMEAFLRREAAAARRELARMASSSGWGFSFETVQDSSRRALAVLLRAGDAALVADHASPRGFSQARPVTALVDASRGGEPGQRRVLEVARRVAAAENAPLRVLPIGAAAATVNAGTGDSATLPEVLARLDASLVLVEASLLDAAGERAGDLCAALDVPLVVLR